VGKISQKNFDRSFAYESESGACGERLVLGVHGCQQPGGGVPVVAGGVDVARGAEIYEFEVRGLRVDDDRVSFYINAVDGFQLPDIMQWWKQTFSVRFNLECGRSGHVWGERYWSVVLGREPPEWAEACDLTAAGWVEGGDGEAECEDADKKTASGRVQREGSHHVGKRAKNPRVQPGSPGCAAPSTV
jgi:hypothetical protein